MRSVARSLQNPVNLSDRVDSVTKTALRHNLVVVRDGEVVYLGGRDLLLEICQTVPISRDSVERHQRQAVGVPGPHAAVQEQILQNRRIHTSYIVADE